MTGQEARGEEGKQEEETPVPLSLSSFVLLCENTTKANAQTGKKKNCISDSDLALLVRHGEAGGCISMEMTRAMRVALFADGACTQARSHVGAALDFPTFKKRDEQGNQRKGRPPGTPQHDHNHTDHQNSTAVAVAAAHAQNGPLATLEHPQTNI